MNTRLLKRSAAGIAGFFVISLGSMTTLVETRWDRRFDAPYPEIRASNDPAVIERGRYLVYGPAHCVACHTPIARQD